MPSNRYAHPEPLSLALDPLDPIEPPRDRRKRRNRTSISSPKLSDAEAFKRTYNHPTSNPTFAASMTHLPTSGFRATSPTPRFSQDIGREPYSPSRARRSRDNSGDTDTSDTSDNSTSSTGSGSGSGASPSLGSTQPAPYEPLRASSAAHARVQRNLAKRAMASTMSLSVAHEVEEKEDRNHRVFAGSKVARWMNKFVRR